MRQLILIRFFVLTGLLFSVLPALWAAPSSADKSFETASQFIRLGNDQQAAVEFQHFLDAFPNDSRYAQAAFFLGYSYQRLQQLDKAQLAYAKVLAKAVGNDAAELRARAHFQMGSCYFAKSDYTKAEQSYSNFLTLSGKVEFKDESKTTSWHDMIINAHYRRAECLNQLGKKDDALSAYAKVYTSAPTSPLASWACYMTGVIQLKQGRFEKAIEAFENISRNYASSEVAGEASLELGVAYLGRARIVKDSAQKESDYQKAIALLTSSFQSDNIPVSSKRQVGSALAEAYYETGDLTKSEATYAKTLAFFTDEPANEFLWQTRLQHGHILYLAKRYADARKEYARIAENKIFPALASEALFWSANCSYLLGMANTDTKALSDAASAINRFLTPPGDKGAKAPQAAYLLALCYEELADLGDKLAAKKAVDAYSSILKKWPDSDYVLQAKAGISRLSRNMSSSDLLAMSNILPPGGTAWDVALQIAYKEFSANNYSNAIDAAKKVLDGKPETKVRAQAAFLVGASQHKLKHADLAIPYYQQVLTATPEGELVPYIRRALVQAYLDTKNYSGARDAALELVTLPPQSKTEPEISNEQAERLLFLATAYNGTRQYREAQDTYLKLATDYPASPLAPNAIIYMAQIAENSDLQAAVHDYQLFIEKYPEHELVPEVFLAIGADQAQLKEFEKAISAYKNIPETSKVADQAAFNIALAYSSMKNDEEALKQFVAVTEKFSNSPCAVDSWYRIGIFKMSQEKLDEAINAFTQSAKLAGALNIDDETQGALTWFNLATCAYNTRQYSVAVDAFGKVAENYPKSEYAGASLFWKGQAAEKLTSDTQAKVAHDAYLKYLTKYPNGEFAADAAVGIGRSSLASNQIVQARTELIKAADTCSVLEKGDDKKLADRAKILGGEIQYDLAQTYYLEKNYKQAQKEFAAVSLFKYEPWYSLSFLQIARCDSATGDKDSAANTLKLLLKTLPNSEGAKQATAVAKELGITL